MREIYKKILFAFLLFISFNVSFAQKVNLDDIYGRKPEVEINRSREILNKFTWSFGLGYGVDSYKASLVGFDVYYLTEENQPLITSKDMDPSSVDFKLYKDWLTNPSAVGDLPPLADPNDDQIPFPMSKGVLNTGVLNGQRLIKLNTEQNGEVVYKAYAYNLPIQFSLVYNFQERFRIGLGAELVHHRLKYLNPNSVYEPELESTHPEVSTWLFRYYGILGAELWSRGGFTYVADLQIGATSLGSDFNKTAVKPSTFFSFGLPIEREFSEYFRIFLRPSFDVKSYTVSYPGISEELKVVQNGFNFSFGVKIRIPEIKRCSTYHCKTQIKHQHGKKMFRGQPIYLPQNPKMGQIPKPFLNYSVEK